MGNRFDAAAFTRGTVHLDAGGGDDTLLGGSGADTLTGGFGADTLTGGAGADCVRFVNTAQGGDRLTDFSSGSDRLQVVSANFGRLPLGRLAANRLLDAGSAPDSGAAVFLYDPSSGALTFDADGTGAGLAVPIATLAGAPLLVARDIQVVAA